MNLSRLAPAGIPPRSAGRYRWVVVWLSVGCAIALVLSANAVRDYMFVARLLATQQVRHQLTQVAVQVEQQLRRGELKQDTLESALAAGPVEDASVNLRNGDGELLGHAGAPLPAFSFSPQQEHAAFSQRGTLFQTVRTASGEAVVEVFPVRAGRRTPPPASGQVTEAPPRPLLLEVALPLTSASPAVLAPIRRNLLINLSAALSLLATVLLAGAGLRSYAQGRRLEEQVEIARQVQSRLLPNPGLRLDGYQIATEYKPSEQIGGDFYDVFPGDTRGFAVLIGDVSGKGIPAALLMGVIHGAVRTGSWQSAVTDHEEESGKLNRLLCEHASGDRFASMFWCVYDEPLHSLRYVNAGHCPPFLLSRRNGELTTIRLDKGGPVLGLLPKASYEATSVEVRTGDLLVMYSDGVVEANNAEDHEYGEDRLLALLHDRFDESPAQLREALRRSLLSFTAGKEAHDDLTFAIIRCGAESGRALEETLAPIALDWPADAPMC